MVKVRYFNSFVNNICGGGWEGGRKGRDGQECPHTISSLQLRLLHTLSLCFCVAKPKCSMLSQRQESWTSNQKEKRSMLAIFDDNF